MRAALLLLVCAGCTPHHFFVRSEGADLPVWIRGEVEADTLIVVTHGSGSSGHLYDPFPAFDRLEGRHAVAYWDQRGAGASQGNAPADTLNHVASARDLGLVLDALDQRVGARRVVLLGHSLGGGISQAFLADQPPGIAGYVDVSGGRSLPESYGITRDRMIAVAESEGWEAIAAFYRKTKRFPREEPDRSQHAANVVKVLDAQGYDMALSTAQMSAFLAGAGVKSSLFGGFDLLEYSANTAGHLSVFDLEGMDLSVDDVALIEVPTLVVAGRHDLSVPVEVSEATFAAFAEDIDGSTLVVLEDSGHFPMWDQGDAFAREVLDFVDGLP